MAPSKVQLSQRQDWKLSRLKPYDNNPLNHDPSAVSSLAEKIREFGFVDPITVDEDGVILWGHKRRLAAMALKLETVPVVVVSGLTPTQKKSLRIAHNQEGRKSAWDMEALVSELKSLEAEAADLTFTGFSPEELQGFFSELDKVNPSAETKPKATPPATADLVFDSPSADPPTPDQGPESEEDPAPTSSVRVLQLYFDDDSLAEALALIDQLHLRFSTTTTTACVLEALRVAAE